MLWYEFFRKKRIHSKKIGGLVYRQCLVEEDTLHETAPVDAVEVVVEKRTTIEVVKRKDAEKKKEKGKRKDADEDIGKGLYTLSFVF